jgi:hypothetical protein
MSFELKVKDISLQTFILTGKINNSTIINNLIDIIKKTKDEKLSYKTNVKGHFTGFKSLVENIDFHNFLRLIKRQIKVVYSNDFIVKDVWGNICKLNEEVIEHEHGNISAFCGILYLSEGGPGTYFKEYDLTISEEIGKYVLFHPKLLHSVKKIDKNIERITLAFNMDGIRNWDNLTDYKRIKNDI